ncbi:hypothetical protein HYPSUDRAFT_134549 [Hypholoma sublateritium FD-334 SS-4]|uniref:Fungal-type protein kinase domain-containing protein n=1 Tax=Hypholoma sublateritium (strain FD-334 SS-4) TaxID=945553 RepID=A0A0D2PAA1_HYPSF|nr:hypothetical protein HYPSUDRAFT_134549 [Hypholoma sublateritium FD-334 SS-4]
MTVDLLSGNVTSIRVREQQFTVVKHIHASLVLFGRGTHVFLVQDKDGQHHILKDAWLLVDHGISEVQVLSQIHQILEKDTSEDAKAYRTLHSRYVTGEELGDSTNERRGRLTNKPPDRVHRRVVTGPVGDPLTTFRSRQEFVQVILDCVKWLDFLHNKCNLVHGDLSINNIVIFRAPAACPPPPRTFVSKKGAAKPNIAARITRTASRQQRTPMIPAPLGGVDDSIPVVGTIIDYDYSRPLNTLLEKTSGTLPFMPLDALNIDNRGKYVHHPAHDLEALLQTVLGIVMFTDGPYKMRPKTSTRIPMARWYNEIDREQLYKDKSYDVQRFDRDIAAYAPQYWQPLIPYLRRLVAATWIDINCSSKATHKAYSEILEEALTALKKHPEVPAKYACGTTPKRPRTTDGVDESRWPYKFLRGDGPSCRRLPRHIDIKKLSEWQDSVDA